MKRAVNIILSLCLILTLCSCSGAAAPTWQEQYDLGVKYLSEGNYEEAIIAFTAAIEIDPKQPAVYHGRAQAYILSGETEANLAAALADYEQAVSLDETLADGWLGLADVYIRMGEYDKALEVLKEGLSKTNNDSAIAEKIAEMEGGTIADSDGKTRRMNSYDGSGALIWYHTYSYNEQGEEASITSFDAAGNQTGHVDFDSDGNFSTYYWHVGETGEVGKGTCEYNAAGQMVKSQMYSLEGQPEWYSLYTYDGDGNEIREDKYDSNGESMGYETYEYANGQQIRRNIFLETGELGAYELYFYNEDGNRARTEWYSGDNELNGYKVWLFDEDGNYLGYQNYDADGTLLQTTVDG